MDSEASALLRKLRSEVASLQSQLNMTKIQGDVPASLPGQYPGKPIPHTESVEIDVAANTTPVQNTITLASDGPFLAQRIHFAYRATAGALAGMWRPLSHYQDQSGAVMIDAIDFYWEYQVSGSYRMRQNNPIPSSLISGMELGNGAFDLYVQDAFDPRSTITIKITPTIAPTHAGVIWFGFHGCYVLQ